MIFTHVTKCFKGTYYLDSKFQGTFKLRLENALNKEVFFAKLGTVFVNCFRADYQSTLSPTLPTPESNMQRNSKRFPESKSENKKNIFGGKKHCEILKDHRIH